MSSIQGLLLAVAAVAAAPPPPPARPWFNPAVVFQPFRPGGIYRKGERVGWRLDAPLGLGRQRFGYVVEENGGRRIDAGTVDLASGEGAISARLDRPGIVVAHLVPLDGEGRAVNLRGLAPAELDRLRVAAAVDPARLAPAAPRPADFAAFWAGKLAALARVPINPHLVPLAGAPAGVRLADVTLDSVAGHVRGYLATPDRPGRFPALIVFQFAGVYALQPDAATARAAEGWLTFNVDAHDMPPTAATAPANYAELGADDRDRSYFLGMYLRDTRALDYVRSRPDWDGRTIVLMGTSMGGQQSIVTAGLNPGKVTAVVVNVSAGADVAAGLRGRQAGYPNWRMDDAAVARTAPYFDPANFAPDVSAPTLAGIGLLDTTSPPAGIFATLNRLGAPSEAVVMPDSDHNHITPQAEGAFYRRSRMVLAALRTTGRFVPECRWSVAGGSATPGCRAGTEAAGRHRRVRSPGLERHGGHAEQG